MTAQKGEWRLQMVKLRPIVQKQSGSVRLVASFVNAYTFNFKVKGY